MQPKTRGTLMLLGATVIWGTAFVAQSVGMDYLGPFTFNAVRYFLGALVLVPVIVLLRALGHSAGTREYRALTAKIGVLCGLVLFVAASFQQVGIVYTTVGKAGFITALYVVLVPVLGLFAGERVPLRVWGCIALAVAGMYLLCIDGGLRLGLGDSLVLVCAAATAGHILLVGRFSARVDAVKLSCIQFLTCGALSLVAALLFETIRVEAIFAARLPILYTGFMSCGVAYTCQVVGQKYVPNVIAALIFSLESVFSVISGWLLLGETLSGRELIGCAVMLAAILVSQLPIGEKPAAVEELPPRAG